MRPYLMSDGCVAIAGSMKRGMRVNIWPQCPIPMPKSIHFACSHDSGNVVVSEIDGPVVKLELQGACGSCPSSTMTMKMGLERRLKEKIPEISEVIQAMPEGPALTEANIDGVRACVLWCG